MEKIKKNGIKKKESIKLLVLFDFLLLIIIIIRCGDKVPNLYTRS